jgi:hypothetical protein
MRRTRAEIAERRERVAVLLRAGRSVRQVAEETGLSIQSVYGIRSAFREPDYRRRLYTPEEVARIEEMLADGASIAEIARTVGRGRKALWKRFRGRGWTREQVAEWHRLDHGILRT